MVVLSFVTGGSITASREYLPFVYLSTLLSAVGVGMITTFEASTGHSKWIGYQVIFGAGVGMGIQIPVIVAQLTLASEDIPAVTALMIFSQTFGGAAFIAVAQSVIQSQLQVGLQQLIPDGTSKITRNIGATDLGSLVPSDRLPEARKVYNDSLVSAWYISAALAAACITCAVGMKRVRPRGLSSPRRDVTV
jgi:hypothetical protein